MPPPSPLPLVPALPLALALLPVGVARAALGLVWGPGCVIRHAIHDAIWGPGTGFEGPCPRRPPQCAVVHRYRVGWEPPRHGR
ncbi:MAG: hypothetical protein K2X49_08010 [Acetobacteraceae bacterium]|nr:hypothetical protein [Acetobacteraceae bacterium]